MPRQTAVSSLSVGCFGSGMPREKPLESKAYSQVLHYFGDTDQSPASPPLSELLNTLKPVPFRGQAIVPNP